MTFYYFFIFGFANNAARYPKKIAAAMPPAAAFMPPENAPIRPMFFTSSIAPLAKRLPNPVNGTVAPAPAKLISFGYNPTAPKITPVVTKITSILAEVSFVLSISI